MSTKLRNRKIRELHFDQGLNFSKIAKKYNLSAERISQICEEVEDKKTILKEVKRIYNFKTNHHPTLKALLEDIVDVSKHNRKKNKMILRKQVIRFLHDELEMPFYQIGSLINRDHSTIIHDYYNG